ncbi:MAG: hypothetical protein AAFV85_26990 [Cyanobacteria bacterium J06634_6]
MTIKESKTLEEEATKHTKKEVARTRMLRNLAAKRLSGVREKVAYILNNFPHTRNSDVDLAFKYWGFFHSDKVVNETISKKNFSEITRYTSITRARAKIQNEFGLYQADIHVANRRKELSEHKKDVELLDKPDIPIIEFYLDESSKNSEYLAVGGLCSVDAIRSYQLTQHLRNWTVRSFSRFLMRSL